MALVSADYEEIAARLGEAAERSYSLAPLTTYKVGGPAEVFVTIENETELANVAEVLNEFGCPFMIIGRGSNLLISDNGFSGVVGQLGADFESIDILAETSVIEAGGAARLPVIARRSVTASLSGFEWAVGVPGSLGGAVRMNAGGHGSDMKASLESARVFDLQTGEVSEWSLQRLNFGYRTSDLQQHQVVLSACLQLSPGDRDKAAEVLDEIVTWRRQNQPGGRNAGSVFANPKDHPGDRYPGEKYKAGRLIDSVGLKGYRLGSAEVSTKHANFIQVDEGGSAEDVYRLLRLVQQRVEQETGVRLEPENKLVGF